ncbi:MAG: DUF1501 domain-containing protein, partial [Gammaproteobacteria bacterium]
LDTFDLKEGRWTPPDFDVRTIKPGLVLPYGLFPKLAQQIDQVAIVRSVEAWESAHARALYYLQAGHAPSPARQKEIPSLGAIVAYEMRPCRRPSDFLPPFIAMNFAGGLGVLVGEGCLSHELGPVALDVKEESPLVVLPEERSVFERRWRLLQEFEDFPRVEAKGHLSQKLYQAFHSSYGSAFALMSSPRLPGIFRLKEEEQKRYGNSALGDACILARRLVEADAGTRYISISHNGWDLHAKMFDRNERVNHYTLCKELDNALASLLEDLARTKAADGKTLLEKTFIVAMGEFGRTGGDLTVNKGRDHNRMAQTALFAGAGVRGGRTFGVTDGAGVKILSSEWGKKRSILTEDVVATIYSQLGIDWTKKITNTPSGRVFEYLESASGTAFVDISEVSQLFAS